MDRDWATGVLNVNAICGVLLCLYIYGPSSQQVVEKNISLRKCWDVQSHPHMDGLSYLITSYEGSDGVTSNLRDGIVLGVPQ